MEQNETSKILGIIEIIEQEITKSHLLLGNIDDVAPLLDASALIYAQAYISAINALAEIAEICSNTTTEEEEI